MSFFTSAQRGRSPATGVVRPTGPGVSGAGAACTEQRAWSSSAGQALDLLKKTADNLLRAQQTSQETSHVTEHELLQSKQETIALQHACQQEKDKQRMLRAEKLEVVERFQELKRFNDMCHKLHCSLQFDVTHLKANLQQSEADCRDLQASLEQCEQHFNGKVAEFAQLGLNFEARIEDMQSQAQSRFDMFKHDCDQEAKAAQQQSRAELEMQKQCLAELSKVSDRFKAQKESEVAVLNQKLTEQHRLAHAMEERLAQSHSKGEADGIALQELYMQLHQSQEERESLQLAMESAQNTCTSLQQNLDALKDSGLQQMTTLEVQLADKEHFICDLEAERQTLTVRANAQQESLQAANARLQSAQTDSHRHSCTISQLETRVADSDAAISAATARLESHVSKTQQEFVRIKSAHAYELQQEMQKGLRTQSLFDQSKQTMGAEVTLLTSQAAQLQCSLSKAHEEQQELSQRTHTQHMQDAAIISEQQAKLAALQANIADLKTTAAAAEHQHHASLLLVIGEKEAEQRQATEHQTELQRELKHSCEERAVIHMQLDLANKELYKKQQTAEAALQELKEILMQKDDELDVCSSEAAALQQQLYHADSKIESLVLTLGEQSIELDNKTMLLQQISHHAAQPAAEPSPRRPPHAVCYPVSSPYKDRPRQVSSQKEWKSPAGEVDAGESTDEEGVQPQKKLALHSHKPDKPQKELSKRAQPSSDPGRTTSKPAATTVTASRKRGSIFTSMSAHNSGQKQMHDTLAEEDSPAAICTKAARKRARNAGKSITKVTAGAITPSQKQRKGYHAASIGEMFAGFG